MSQHAIERARERYGVELTRADLQFVKAAILGDSPFCFHICQEFNCRLVVAIRIRCRWMAFVVTQQGNAVTVLQESRLDPFRKPLDIRKRELRAAGLEATPKKPFWKKEKRAASPAT